MNKITTKWLAALLVSTVGFQTTPSAAQNIELNGGSGDIFFLYNSSAGVWNTVFRVKTSTDATGLTNPFNASSTPSTWDGILGNQVPTEAGANGDHIYETLTVNLNVTQTLSVDGTDFFFADANGHFTNNVPTADLGLRIRLREDQVAMGDSLGNTNFNQFANFTFAINTELSTFNGVALEDTSAHVSLFANDGLDGTAALFNSATTNLEGTFNTVWTHTHRNWGFSEYGEYSVVLDVTGVGGEHGDSTHQATVGFNVIPEPSTFALVLVGLGFGGFIRKKRLQNLG